MTTTVTVCPALGLEGVAFIVTLGFHAGSGFVVVKLSLQLYDVAAMAGDAGMTSSPAHARNAAAHAAANERNVIRATPPRVIPLSGTLFLSAERTAFNSRGRPRSSSPRQS